MWSCMCVLEIERQQDEVNKHTTHTNSHPQTPLNIKLRMQFKLKIFVKFHFAWNMFVICLLEEFCFALALPFVVHVLILFGLYLKYRLRNRREENAKEKIWLLLFILICVDCICAKQHTKMTIKSHKLHGGVVFEHQSLRQGKKKNLKAI